MLYLLFPNLFSIHSESLQIFQQERLSYFFTFSSGPFILAKLFVIPSHSSIIILLIHPIIFSLDFKRKSQNLLCSTTPNALHCFPKILINFFKRVSIPFLSQLCYNSLLLYYMYLKQRKGSHFFLLPRTQQLLQFSI